MNAIRPELQELLTRQAGQDARRRPQRRRRAALLGGTGGLALASTAAFLVIGASSPQGAPLSPRAAVAAAANTLEQDQQMLHWVRRLDFIPGAPASHATTGYAVQDEWTDLASGDTKTTQQIFRGTQTQPSETTQSGHSGGKTWFAPGGGVPVQILPTQPQTDNSDTGQSQGVDVGGVRRALQRAERGEATIAAAGDMGGVPVAVVTDELEGGITVRTWVTREESPRVVKTSSTVPRDGAPPVTLTTTTQSWTVTPRTEGTAENVAIPD